MEVHCLWLAKMTHTNTRVHKMYPCLFLAVKTHAAAPLSTHTPTPTKGRDNTGASRGFDAAVPGPPSVPSFLCLNRRKEALSSMRPQGSGDQEGA